MSATVTATTSSRSALAIAALTAITSTTTPIPAEVAEGLLQHLHLATTLLGRRPTA